MHGPRLDLDTTSIVPVQMRRIHERCDLPDGLAVTTDGRRVSAYFSKPMTSSDEIRTWGDFVVRRISGRLTLVGFVAVHYSDLFIAGPTGTGCPQLRAEGNVFTENRWMGAVEAQFTAPEPGPIDVVIFANEGAAVRHATAVVVE